MPPRVHFRITTRTLRPGKTHRRLLGFLFIATLISLMVKM